MKNTMPVLQAWRAHPHWPPLVVTCARQCQLGPGDLQQPARPDMSQFDGVSNIYATWGRMPAPLAARFRRAAGFVIMPSGCEGFGYALHEAQRHGSVLVTVDAPPMNEICRDGETCILLPPAGATPIHLGNGKNKSAAAGMPKLIKKNTSRTRALHKPVQKIRLTYCSFEGGILRMPKAGVGAPLDL